MVEGRIRPGNELERRLADVLVALVDVQACRREFVEREQLVLDQGRFWTAQPLPTGVRRRRAGYCFLNTLRVTTANPRLRYVEGFALIDDRLVMPIQHAWAIDQEGRVIDTTWPNPEHAAYLGIVFARKDVVRVLVSSHHGFAMLPTLAPCSTAFRTNDSAPAPMLASERDEGAEIDDHKYNT